MGLIGRVARIALGVATSIALAYSLFGLGFSICTMPQATSIIGGTFSGWEHATYPEEDMSAIAEAVRSFSIEGTSSEDLHTTINEVLAKTQPDIAAAFNAGSIVDSGIDPSAFSADLSTLEERYSLPQDALSHLQDCTPVFTTGRISTGVVGAFGIAGLIAILVLAGRKWAGKTLIAAAGLVVAVLLTLGAWAVLDFDGLFAWMHSLFFAQGSWLFDSRSLLITLFPEAFWAAMAGLWIVSSLVLAGITALAGKLIKIGA